MYILLVFDLQLSHGITNLDSQPPLNKSASATSAHEGWLWVHTWFKNIIAHYNAETQKGIERLREFC